MLMTYINFLLCLIQTYDHIYSFWNMNSFFLKLMFNYFLKLKTTYILSFIIILDSFFYIV